MSFWKPDRALEASCGAALIRSVGSVRRPLCAGSDTFPPADTRRCRARSSRSIRRSTGPRPACSSPSSFPAAGFPGPCWAPPLILFATWYRVRAGRPDQRVVRHLLRPGAEGAEQAGLHHDGRLLGAADHLPAHRHAVRHHRGGAGLLRQALHLPLAHGDERLLHAALGQAAPHRGRRPAGAGGHDALRQHHGGAGHRLHAQPDGAGRPSCRSSPGCRPR